ncbi:MAG: hypothetical protein ACSLFM_09680 [Tepidiformaceae bacterium]
MSTERAIAEAYDPARNPRESLDALYRSWRILDLVGDTVDEMPPGWLRILNIARHMLSGLPVPGVELPDDLRDLVSAETQYTTVVRSERKRKVVFPTTGDTEVQPLRNVLDLQQVTLPDLMLRKLSPALFDFRLMSGSINGVYNIDSTPRIEEYDEVVEERVSMEGPGRRKRQKVYTLLDVSNSMRDANKIVFAKALLLAYLLKACEEGAQLYLRTFGNTVHFRSDCIEPGGFAELARRILSVTPDGSTDLERTLNQAIIDIRGLDLESRMNGRMFDPPPTEILLISDCESYSIPHIPHGIKLHTVHLKGGNMMKAYTEGFEAIREASQTFHEIDTTLLALPNEARDRWLLLQDGRPLAGLPEPAAMEIEGDPGRISRQQHESLAQVYERMNEDPDSKAASRTKAVKSMTGNMSFDPMVLLRWIAEIVQKLIPRRRAKAPEAAPAPFGMNFRVRH